MVTKIVTTASQGNLFNAADMFGLGNDTLFLAIPTPNLAAIRTYGGNDFVTVLNSPSGSWGYKFYLGLGNDTLSGSSLKDVYYDEGGNDQINMGAGGDDVHAGPGDDTIDGAAGSDTIYFGSAFDLFGNSTPVTQGVILNLASTGSQDLGFYGNDTFLNFENIVGGAGDDTFFGTNGNNVLGGQDGSDVLRGFGGVDSIIGGAGNDTLIGDAGGDNLYAGGPTGGTDGDADIIKYLRISDSTLDDMDTIFGFEHFAGGGSDKIDLSSLDANSSLAGNQAFQFVGLAGFSSASGEVRLATFDGATLVMIDNDGDSAAEMVILVQGVTGLTADDFIL
jgi:Ca2+-binding RTX toxin-like protein